MQFTGKTVDEAIENGLKDLGIEKDQAEITVVEEPTKGLFGKIKGKAVVEIVKKEETETKSAAKTEEKTDETATVEFVQKILDLMDITAKAQLSGENSVNIIAAESSEVIGFRGEVLDALQTLAGTFANIGKKNYVKITVDCENYRGRREETLIKLANRLADKAVEMRREVILEPMNPFDRRIIHTALSENDKVSTRSDGKEPNRYVVIVPNDKDEYSKPYNAGKRHEERRGGRNGGRDRKFDGRREGRRQSGFTEPKRKSTFGFGTFIGNSLKDDNE